MSYILDALNKADKDRQQQVPISSTPTSPQHQPTTTRQTNAGKYGLFIVFIAVVLLVVWVLVSNDETPSLQQDTLPQKTQAITPTPSKIETVVPVKKATSQPIQQTATQTEPVQEKIKTIPNIMALDATIRNQLPPIAISAHVYSEEASKRMVIINHQVKREGQYIAEELILEQILIDKVQLNFAGIIFNMKVKDQWPPY